MNNVAIQDIKCTETDIDIIDIEKAKELFNSCKYNDAEQIFSNMKGSGAAAWRILCYIMNGDIGKRGGKISTLIQESMRNQDAAIDDTITQLKILINEYESALDKKTKNKVMALLNEATSHVIKEKMMILISDVNKRALQIIKEKGYTLSIYEDKTIPLKILNSRLKKYKCRIRHYKSDDITSALKIINSENFVQDVVDEYMSLAQYQTVHIDKDHLDTRNQDILKYIKGLYIWNIAYEKELKFTRSMGKLQFLDNLKNLHDRGLVRMTISCTENTRHFNMSNEDEKSICEKEIEKASIASIVVSLISLINKDIIERRGYMIYDETVNQISKEDIVIGDVTDRYTREYVGPVLGTIYYDN